MKIWQTFLTTIRINMWSRVQKRSGVCLVEWNVTEQMLRVVAKQIFFHSFSSPNKVQIIPVERYKMWRSFIFSCYSVSFNPHSWLISKICIGFCLFVYFNGGLLGCEPGQFLGDTTVAQRYEIKMLSFKRKTQSWSLQACMNITVLLYNFVAPL